MDNATDLCAPPVRSSLASSRLAGARSLHRTNDFPNLRPSSRGDHPTPGQSFPPSVTTTGLPAPPSHTRYAFATVAGSGFDTRVTRDAFGCESRRCETTSAAEIVAEGPRAALASAETRAQKSTKESHSSVERRGATSLAAAMFAACGACVGSFGSGPRRSIILAAIVWSWSKSMSSVAGDGGTACDVPCDEQTPLPRDLRAASSSHRASQPIAAGNWTT
mmetsp:Transcript_3404/g.14942  ORF Transcript_3404/g.14942 Transcript_3404/m.14942 type:complete len:220 (-) Transcript_3404:479-1138(-)